MAISTSKRNLLFGQISARPPIRPPWSIGEEDFVETCNRCGECVTQCPRHVIRIADGRFPAMNFSSAGCDFCAVCVAVCKPEALKLNVVAGFNRVAEIGSDCFSERGVICRSCGEVCESQSIRFQSVVGGITHVLMDTELCTGCGECISICPAHAITMKQHQPMHQEKPE